MIFLSGYLRFIEVLVDAHSLEFKYICDIHSRNQFGYVVLGLAIQNVDAYVVTVKALRSPNCNGYCKGVSLG